MTKLKMLIYFENEETLILEATRILNRLRNGIAHSLDVNEQLIQEFFANLDKALPPNKSNFRNEKLDIPLKLTSGIAIIL